MSTPRGRGAGDGDRRRRPPRPAPPPAAPSRVGLGLVLLRLHLGALLAWAACFKLQHHAVLAHGFDAFVEADYRPLVEAAAADPPALWGWRMAWFGDLMRDVMLPGAATFAPLILLGELALGLGLLLGLGTRLVALLGALLLASFALARHLPVLTVQAPNWVMVAGLVAVAAGGAGRRWGIDAWLRPRMPPWLRWTA